MNQGSAEGKEKSHTESQAAIRKFNHQQQGRNSALRRNICYPQKKPAGH
jgi:hypothetical protein